MSILIIRFFYCSAVETGFASSSVALIVPVRNEANRIIPLLESLNKNSIPKEQILFVDDHSSDNTFERIKEYGFSVIDLKDEEVGKKAALIRGVSEIRTEYVLFNDADVYHPESYFQLLKEVPFNGDFDLCVLPVEMKNETSVLNKLIQIDFAWLQFLTFSYQGNLGNGANLLVKRDAFIQLSNDLNQEILSGDDYFLIKEAKKKNKRVQYLRSAQFRIETSAPKNIRSLMDQRARWIHKSFKSKNTIEILSTMLWVAVSLLPIFFLGVYISSKEINYCYLLLIKIGIDSIVFILALYFIKRLRLLYLLPLMSILYPIYYISVVVRSGFRLNWKDRAL